MVKFDLNHPRTPKDLLKPVKDYLIAPDTAFNGELTIQELFASDSLLKDVAHQTKYLYVVDADDRLIGVASTRAVLFSKRHLKLSQIADKEVISLQDTDTIKDALVKLIDNELLSIPVVDAHYRLVGIFEVTGGFHSPSLPSSLKIREAKNNIFQLIGLSVSQGEGRSSLIEYRHRMPWLLCNILSGLTCAVIADAFQEVLLQVLVLAMFIPLVLTLAESIAMQSVVLSLHFLTQKRVFWKRVVGRLLTELKTALLLGLSCCLLTGGAYLFLEPNLYPLWAIALSILASMAVSTLFGALFPIILHLFSWEPKVASGPVVLMCTDVCATALYLGLSAGMLL